MLSMDFKSWLDEEMRVHWPKWDELQPRQKELYYNCVGDLPQPCVTKALINIKMEETGYPRIPSPRRVLDASLECDRAWRLSKAAHLRKTPLEQEWEHCANLCAVVTDKHGAKWEVHEEGLFSVVGNRAILIDSIKEEKQRRIIRQVKDELGDPLPVVIWINADTEEFRANVKKLTAAWAKMSPLRNTSCQTTFTHCASSNSELPASTQAAPLPEEKKVVDLDW